MTEKTKKVNYTDAQTADLKAAYAADPTPETVKTWAEANGKGVGSARMKLVREGVYKAKEYVAKTGEKPQPKADIADAIGKVLKLAEPDVTSLEKASKAALKAVFAALANSVPVEPLTADEVRSKAENVAHIAAELELSAEDAKGLSCAGAGVLAAMAARF